MIKNLTLLFLLSIIATSNSFSQQHPGFRVQGRFLYDACGEKVILRGVSNPNIWFEKNGTIRYTEIAQTGANVVRIVWETKGSVTDLDAAITNCRAKNMIPMIELHDATGDWSKLQTCVNYWIRTDVANLLQEHEEYLLVNIANEVGDGNISKTTFRADYIDAITQMRNAGIHVPLIIDGSDWGKNVNILQSEGKAIIEADPDHNIMFSVHMWWPKMYGYSEQSIVTEIAESVKLELPMIVGEFSQMHGSCEERTITANNSIAYKTILRECQKTETGYIAWSWFGNCNPLWDMSTKGTYATLYSWGLDVAVDDENSIQKTSVRPYSIINGGCDPKVGISELENNLKNGSELKQNFPNPVYHKTTFGYIVGKNANVELSIFDLTGKTHQTLVNKIQIKGEYQLDFDASTLEPGLYFYTLRVDDNYTTKKMVVIKQ